MRFNWLVRILRRLARIHKHTPAWISKRDLGASGPGRCGFGCEPRDCWLEPLQRSGSGQGGNTVHRLLRGRFRLSRFEQWGAWVWGHVDLSQLRRGGSGDHVGSRSPPPSPGVTGPRWWWRCTRYRRRGGCAGIAEATGSARGGPEGTTATVSSLRVARRGMKRYVQRQWVFKVECAGERRPTVTSPRGRHGARPGGATPGVRGLCHGGRGGDPT